MEKQKTQLIYLLYPNRNVNTRRHELKCHRKVGNGDAHRKVYELQHKFEIVH